MFSHSNFILMKKIIFSSVILVSNYIHAQIGVYTVNPAKEIHIGTTNNGKTKTNSIRIDGLNATNNPTHKQENQSEDLYVNADGVLVINSKKNTVETFKKTPSNKAPFNPVTVDVLTTTPETITPLYNKNFTIDADALLMYTFQPMFDMTPNIDNEDMFFFASTRHMGCEINIEKEIAPGTYTNVYRTRKASPIPNKPGDPDVGELGILKSTINISDMVPLDAGVYKLSINGYAYRSFTDDPTQDQTRNPYKVRYDMANDSEMNFFIVTP
jgi:hypothetical protein